VASCRITLVLALPTRIWRLTKMILQKLNALVSQPIRVRVLDVPQRQQADLLREGSCKDDMQARLLS